MFAVIVLADCLDCGLLIVPVSYVVIDRKVRNILSISFLDKSFKVILTMETI